MDDANDWIMLISQSIMIVQAAGTDVVLLHMPHKRVRL